MNINEPIVEDAVLTWFGELGYAVGHGPHIAPGEPAGEYGLRPPGIAFKGEAEMSVQAVISVRVLNSRAKPMCLSLPIVVFKEVHHENLRNS